MITDILINGVISGGVYALLAVGFALIFSVAGIINIAHTAFYMIAAFLIFIAIDYLGWHLIPAVIVGILITIALGIVCFKVLFDRIKEHETAIMMMSIGLAIVFQEILLLIFGGSFHGMPPFFEGFMEIGGTRVSFQHLIALLVIGIVLIGLWLWLSKTRIGNAIRAVSEDRETANLMGVNVAHIYLVVMGVSVGLAGIAAAVMAPIYMISPLMWVQPIVAVLASVILGGMGSISGAVIGAFILGYVETLVVFLIPSGSFLGQSASLLIMVLVLLMRPEGLFGVFFEEERL
jgi:branched-chain amino acid transport system permease protein